MDGSRELQLLYFNLIADLFEQKLWDDSMIHKLLQKICEFMEMDYLAIYVHFEKSASLHLLAAVVDEEEYKPERIVMQNKDKPEDFFQDNYYPQHLEIFPLQVIETETILLLFNKKQRMSKESIFNFKNETEKFLSVIIRTWRKMLQNSNNKILLDTSSKLIKALDKHDVLHEIVEALNKVYSDYDYHLILTQEYENNTSLPIKVLEYGDETPIPVSTQVFMTGELQMEIIKDQLKKVIYVPLLGEQSVYGVLEIIAPIDSYFTNLEMEFIEEFAVLSGKALEKTILYEDSLVQVSNLTLLHEIIQELNAARELKELIELIRNQVVRITKASEIGFIYFDEESSDDFELLVGSTPFFKGDKGRELATTYTERIINSPNPIFSGNERELIRYGFQSAMVIPMVYSGLSMGYTIVLHEDPYHFTFENFKLIESLMQHSALAISNTILRERLQTTVITDFLTQLYSRRYLEDTINDHLDKGAKGTFLLFDIDDFKGVNDMHGHHVGDRVLKQVSKIMENAIGNKGIVARWGGEELAIYLPEITSQQGEDIANEIRESIPLGTDPSITVSCGVSYWEQGFNDTQETLFLQADQALYKAKSEGKDCVLTL